MPCRGIARWNGHEWSALGAGTGKIVHALTVLEGQGRPALIAGGSFFLAPSGDDFLASWRCALSPFRSIPGCVGNAAVLEPNSPVLAAGESLAFVLTSTNVPQGVAVLLVGADGSGPLGCGLALPGLGEWLLAPDPAPVAFATAPLSEGTASFLSSVPAAPGLVGLELAFQGAAFARVDPSAALELSNALIAIVAP